MKTTLATPFIAAMTLFSLLRLWLMLGMDKTT